ncbi:MAG: DUF6798 domain-containing protein [Pseudomonadota bacterium]
MVQTAATPRSAATLFSVLFVVALGLGGHAVTGFQSFPLGDDFTYAPLAELAADPNLFPRDEHLRLFANHATIYEWVYRAAKATIGVERGFLAAVVVLAVAAVAAVAAVLRALGCGHGRGFAGALAIAIGLGVVVAERGIGRGAYGGYLSEMFHHQFLALIMVMAALAATLSRRAVLAGVALGIAAWAQPASAAHGALAVTLGWLALGVRGVVPLAISGAVSAVVALPVVAGLAAALLAAPDVSVPTERLIEEAYRFRVPLHYDLPWQALGLVTLYLSLGVAAALALTGTPRRMALGLLAGFVVLHGVMVAVYALGVFEHPVLFKLDITRSTPVVFAFAAALAGAALAQAGEHWRAGVAPGRAVLVVAVLAALTLALNARPVGGLAVGAGLAILASGRLWSLPAVTLAALSLLLTAAVLPRHQLVTPLDPAEAAALDWIARETAEDTLFVIPVSMPHFRQYARRSIYVDFKSFSVAQPDQAWMTRTRLEQVAQPDAKALAARGWPAMALWEAAQFRALDCPGMRKLMTETGAEYVVHRAKDAAGTPRSLPMCGGEGPVQAFAKSSLAVYGGD